MSDSWSGIGGEYAFDEGYRRGKSECARAVGALEKRVAQLETALKLALDYIADGTPETDMPRHDCGYILDPPAGHCDFCFGYAEARAALAKGDKP